MSVTAPLRRLLHMARHRGPSLVALLGLAAGLLLLVAGPGGSVAHAQPRSQATASQVVAQADETLVQGTLRSPDGPISGAAISVATADGQPVGDTTTDDDGHWEVALPSSGGYAVTIDPASLPEGVGLTDPDRTTLTVDVRAGASQFVVFALGPAVGGASLLERVAQPTINGLQFGLLIAMTAIGLSLVFGTTGLINFAHGDIVAFGAIAAYMLSVEADGWFGLPLIVAAIIAVILSGGLGAALDLGIFRPLRKRKVGLFQLLVITIGLSLILRYTLLIIFGGAPRPYDEFIGQRPIDIGPFDLLPRELIIMVASVAVLVAVATMLQRTRIGKAMRAVADNRDLAESSGIDVQRVILIVWIGGSALAGLGGIFYGTILAVDYLFGFRLLLLMFAGVILGGLGTAYGAMVGSIIVGLVTEISTVWFPDELKYAWALMVLVIVLLVRPQGILGSRERLG